MQKYLQRGANIKFEGMQIENKIPSPLSKCINFLEMYYKYFPHGNHKKEKKLKPAI